MALETITGTTVKYLNSFHKVGETVKGYLKTVVAHEGNFGKTWALVLVDTETGTEANYVVGGTAKYVAANLAQSLGLEPADPKRTAEIQKESKMLGCYVEIKPNGSYKNKRGQEIKSFEFKCDQANKLGKTMDEIPF